METTVADPGLWNDPARAQAVLRARTRLTEEIEAFRRLEKKVEDAEVCAELAREGEEVAVDLKQAVDALRSALDERELEIMLTGEHDAGDAILTVHPGAGGTESQDWAEMLYRMYLRWAEGHGFRVEALDYQKGDEAGIKSATLMVRGRNAYGFLRAESGVHRLVRISPFDSSGRRHTSFASVYAYPDLDDRIEVAVEEKDLRVDTYRSSGAGGQHVNVTDSAVRITHLPTGIVVSCQNERSQHRNRDMAMKILRARLYDLERRKRDEKRAVEEGAKKDIDFGSQIRSYVLQPYTLVKDHRTGFERGDVQNVLNGDIDSFVKTYLLSRSRPAAGSQTALPATPR
ncbi:MAG: peptide chain release factor 2 [Acidobacteria bacterium 13_1_40CM_2_68_10]|nr:MAG: peptide chain release factor 2 [Acidobacteria bacterium 13_1_40CM_2_68_10]OLE65713.1 MAG: peptide chain release factor 2 [Acidobacteria bacterium 13_1_20CM_2_68_14]